MIRGQKIYLIDQTRMKCYSASITPVLETANPKVCRFQWVVKVF